VRRLLWLVAVGVILAGVAELIALVPGGRSLETALSDDPAQTVRVEQPVPLPANEVRRALLTGTRFVRTAVARRDVDSSWSLTSGELRQGLSRKDWDTGDIPVVPFPAIGLAAWRVAWTFKNDIGLDLVLVPKPGSSLRPKTFLIELRRVGPAKHGRWLVSGWQPRGLSMSTLQPGPGAPPPTSKLDARWLLLPAGVVGLLLLSLLALAARGWYRGAQAMRAYRSGTL
jgi:hypothetical protein